MIKTLLRFVKSPAPGRVFLCLLLVALFPSAGGADKFTVEVEKFLGEQVAAALVESSGVDTDPLLANWVSRVGNRVAEASWRKEIGTDFTILGTDAANALAAPGGHIFVTRGLLDVIDSEDELAVVLAHEVGHHTKKHAMQQVGANALFLTGLAFVKGDNAPRIKTGLVVLNALRTLHKSREMENQADELGIRFALQTGYDPGGLVHFFEGFDLRRRSRLEEYFATHPSPESRQKAARASPLVTRADTTIQETVARGYQERGFPGAAALARRGADPLILPPLPPLALPAYLFEEQKQIADRSQAISKELGPAYGAQRFGNVLQTLLLINNQADLRWLYIGSRAYALQMRVEDLLARTQRLARSAPTTYDALARYADRRAGDSAALESALGRGEVRQALQRAEGAPVPLVRAARAVATVLTDLNNRFTRLNGTQTWLRYGALEGLLRYAESELARADKMSGEAWRLLSLARIRSYQERLSELVPEDSVGRRARWYALVQRRIGQAFDGAGPAGPATIRAALMVELSASQDAIEEGRGDATWTDRVKESGGVPENIATVLRLLTLDLEREFAAEASIAAGKSKAQTNTGKHDKDQDSTLGGDTSRVCCGAFERGGTLANRNP